MGNLTTEYRRRIAKLLKKRAEIAKKGTNHIDDNWGEDTIYKGELAVHLDSGKLYTSDGSTSVSLNTPNMIQTGLQLMPIATAGGNACWIKISSGRVTINGKTYWHTESSNAEGDFCFSDNSSNSEIYYLVYARPFKPTDTNYSDYAYDEDTQTANMNFFAISVRSEDELYRDNFDDLLGEDKDNCIFLGVVMMPANYYSTSASNKLRPWSVSTTRAGLKYNLINDIAEDQEEISASELLWKIKSGMASYMPGIDEREHLNLVKGQVFTSGAAMYIVLKTHYCASIQDSIDEGLIVPLSGGGGQGGTSVHAQLLGLNWGDTGHESTFQRKTIMSTSEPNASNTPSNVENSDMWFKMSSDSSDAVLEAGFVYYNGKWIEFVNSTKDSYKYKNFTYDANYEFVFDHKQADTFIRLDVNGVGYNYDSDYYFKDSSNQRVRFKDIDNTSPYKLVWCNNDFSLDNEDSLSLSYLESNPIVVEMIIDSTDWNVVYGGSSSENISQ